MCNSFKMYLMLMFNIASFNKTTNNYLLYLIALYTLYIYKTDNKIVRQIKYPERLLLFRDACVMANIVKRIHSICS